MKILIDLRCLQTPPPHGGVPHYAEEATRALLAADRVNAYALFVNGLADPRTHLPQFDAPNVRWIVGRLPNKLLNPAYGVRLTAYGFRDADVVYLPNLTFLPQLPVRTRLIVTVHDLSFEHFPDCFSWKQRLWHRAVQPRKLLSRADAIVAVSETTKRDIAETYGMDDAKIHVVYPGVGNVMRNAEREAQNAKREAQSAKHGDRSLDAPCIMQRESFPYILSLSELSPRKNLDGLIAAFEVLTAHGLPCATPLHLVLAGVRGSAAHRLERLIARSPARERIHLNGSVTDDEKTALLSGAQCFVYPSLWEGFGFPPLEAMAAGCPVIASTGGSLPEVLSDAALLVDPLDPNAIARAIHRVLTDTSIRLRLIDRGRSHVQRYDWQRSGEALARIIRG